PPVSLGAEDNASPAGLAPSRRAAPAVDPGAPGSAPADPPRVPAERPGAEAVPAAPPRPSPPLVIRRGWAPGKVAPGAPAALTLRGVNARCSRFSRSALCPFWT